MEECRGCYRCGRRVENIEWFEREELNVSRCLGCGCGACRPCLTSGCDPPEVLLAQCQECQTGSFCLGCRDQNGIYYCTEGAHHVCITCRPKNKCACCKEYDDACKECMTWGMIQCSFCGTVYHNSGCSDSNMVTCEKCGKSSCVQCQNNEGKVFHAHVSRVAIAFAVSATS